MTVVHTVLDTSKPGQGGPFGLAVYAVAFGVAVLSSLMFTHAVRARARRVGLFDRTDARKVHGNEIPRVGGVGIVLAVAFTCAALLALYGPSTLAGNGRLLLVVFVGGLAIHLVGLVDDVWQLHARWKFLAQIVISVVVFAAGVRMTTLTLPVVGVVELGTVAGLLFTVFWFVGITNAFNLIDGLDGLAGGAALFALTTMFVVAMANGRYDAALATLTLAGATLGFLYYNFHPATIFLGDSGSLFLGFMLAGIGVLSAQKSPTVVAVAIPVVSLGLPVMDTLIAITRRFLRRQPIFAADRGHIHHRLLGYGHSPRTVVLTLYAVCAVLALAAMSLVNSGGHVALVLVTIGLGVGFMIQRLGIYEFQEAARLLRRGVQQRHTIERGVRVREASAKVAAMTDLPAVFEALAVVFAADGCPWAEVRLSMAFLDSRAGSPPTGRRRRSGGADAGAETAVWTWRTPEHQTADPEWWQVTLPFLGDDGERVGSLVMWQTRDVVDSPFPHFHVLAGDLRAQIEGKLLALWPTGPASRELALSFGTPMGSAPAGRERGRAMGRMPSGSGPAVPVA